MLFIRFISSACFFQIHATPSESKSIYRYIIIIILVRPKSSKTPLGENPQLDPVAGLEQGLPDRLSIDRFPPGREHHVDERQQKAQTAQNARSSQHDRVGADPDPHRGGRRPDARLPGGESTSSRPVPGTVSEH